MKLVIAADSFKHCLRSREVVAVLTEGFRRALPEAEIVELPLADGGEGTVEAMVSACGGTVRTLRVCGPLGIPVEAQYGLIDDGKTAVIEMAAASGIELVPPELRNPLNTTTRGTGELIADALSLGVRKLIIGIGGSATCDGGAGMAQALGYHFYDFSGRLLERNICGGMLGTIAEIRPPITESFSCCEILAACDVTNPLLGETGCVRVFAPQKGATPEMLPELEHNLSRFAETAIASGLATSSERPGDGAAGGLGFALRNFLRARLVSGAELMLGAAGFEDHLHHADWVITGEGRTDSQTLSGKLCFKVAETAGSHNVPTIVISGSVDGDPELLLNHFSAVFSIVSGPCTLETAIREARKNLFRTAVSVGKLLSGRR